MGESDRIRVPTNGQRPALEPVATDERPEPPPSPDLRIAVTPGQLAAGFAVLAGLVVLLAGRRRARRDPSGPDRD